MVDMDKDCEMVVLRLLDGLTLVVTLRRGRLT
jgi:hypothetical protein